MQIPATSDWPEAANLSDIAKDTPLLLFSNTALTEFTVHLDKTDSFYFYLLVSDKGNIL